MEKECKYCGVITDQPEDKCWKKPVNKNMENKPFITYHELLGLGFKTIPHFTVMNSLIYDLGRDRHLSCSNIESPNEMLFICEVDSLDPKKITDCICLHNFDYDGYLTITKLKSIIYGITGKLI